MLKAYIRRMHRIQGEFAPRSFPHAWWLSACFHALLFIGCALLWSQAEPQGVEPDRSGEVALVIALPDRTEYLTFEESTASSQAHAAQTSADSTQAAEAGPLPDNPTATTSQLPPALALPLPGALPPSNLEIAVPRTSQGVTVKLPTNTDYSEFLAEEAARIKAQMPRGEPVQVSLFGGPPSVGRSFVFVIDRSKSMGGSGLNALSLAAGELTAALSRLEPVHRIAVIAYHHENTYLDGPTLVNATRENQQRVEPFLNGLAAFGQTEHDVALLGALRLEPDVIYLFTDGGEPHLSAPQLRSIHRIAAAQRTTIHCVQFGQGPLRDPNGFLVRLATQCGGGFTYIDMNAR